MKKKTFRAEAFSGHKGNAVAVPFDPVAVPFDPVKEWGIPPKALWRGRRGHLVNATVYGVSFESSIVPRKKKFYLLIDAETAKAAGVSNVGILEVAVEPYAE